MFVLKIDNDMEKLLYMARVSTLSQDYERQLVELRTYAENRNYEIVRGEDKWC